MSVLNPRNRLVYFRVSEDEFLQFSEMCTSSGARSISDLARSAMKQMLKNPTEDAMIAERLKAFDALISMLSDKLRQVDEVLLQKNACNAPNKNQS